MIEWKINWGHNSACCDSLSFIWIWYWPKINACGSTELVKPVCKIIRSQILKYWRVIDVRQNNKFKIAHIWSSQPVVSCYGSINRNLICTIIRIMICLPSNNSSLIVKLDERCWGNYWNEYMTSFALQYKPVTLNY